MKPFAAWLNDLMPSLPGADNALVIYELRRVSQDFFTRTRAWQEKLDPITVDAGEATVQMVADSSGAEVVRIEAVWIDGKKILADPVTELDATAPNWMAETGAISSITQMSPAVALLTPTPDTATSILFRVSLRPNDTANGLPDDLAAEYRSAIIDGVKAKMMLIPKKPWSNPQIGMAHNAAYEVAVGGANYQAALSFGIGRLRSHPVWC